MDHVELCVIFQMQLKVVQVAGYVNLAPVVLDMEIVMALLIMVVKQR